MHSTVVRPLGLLILVCSLNAQGMTPQFAPTGKIVLPLDLRRSTAIAVADIDQDGLPDIIAGHADSTATIYWQQSTKRLHFTSWTDIPLGGREAISAFAICDFDADGDLDVIVTRQTEGGPNATTLFLKQQDNRTFTLSPLDTSSAHGTSGSSDAITFDANGDGRPDLFITGNRRLMMDTTPSTKNRLYLNQTGGRFIRATQPEPVSSPDMSWPVSGDFDGDGDIDIVGVSFGTLKLILNTGKGAFLPAPPGNLPNTIAPLSTGPAVGDIDGDGDLDIIAPHGQTYYYLNRSPSTQVLINNGKGVFTEESKIRLPSTGKLWDTRLGDIDGDGDLDLVACRNDTITASDHPSGKPFCALNDGTGIFHDVSQTQFVNAAADSSWIGLVDINADGDLDVIALEGERISIRTNDGSGTFTDARHERIPARQHDTVRAQFIDLDSDAWPDLAEISEIVTLRHNLGHGRFGAPLLLHFPDLEVPTCIAAADLDFDGDTDLIVGMAMWTRIHPAQVRMLRNDGGGHYVDVTGSQMPLLRGLASKIVLADIDNDQDIDIVIANGSPHTFFYGSQNRVYTNDGSGHFIESTRFFLPNSKDQTTDVTAGDWNNDGHVDLLFANMPTPILPGINYLYINRGTKGSFPFQINSLGGKAQQNMASAAIHFADFNGDRKLDIVVLNHGVGTQARSHTLYLNNAHGRAVLSKAIHSKSSAAIAVGDFDLDGDSDLMLGGADGKSGTDRLLINDGKGKLTDQSSPRLQALRMPSTSLEAADIDGDGDPDVLAVQDGLTRILMNHHRHLDTPDLPLLGSSSFTYKISAEPGYMRSPIGSVPIYSTELLPQGQRLSPFGIFFLDFRHGFVGRPAVIERHRGSYEHKVTIPNDPSLEGIEVHCQCVIWHLNPHSFARFTNLVSDRVSTY